MENLMNLLSGENWEKANAYSNGTVQKVLRDHDQSKTILLKLPQGFYMAPHSHVTNEQHFVLRGNYVVDGIEYSEGSYQFFSSQLEHGPFVSENGAIILVIWDSFK